MTPEECRKLNEKVSPPTNSLRNLICAFLVGGTICAAGQALLELCMYIGMDRVDAGGACSVTLIFILALLTGLGVYDNVARMGGGGTLVPITGFANAVVSPAMEFKSGGLIPAPGMGISAVCGPVTVCGTAADAARESACRTAAEI